MISRHIYEAYISGHIRRSDLALLPPVPVPLHHICAIVTVPCSLRSTHSDLSHLCRRNYRVAYNSTTHASTTHALHTHALHTQNLRYIGTYAIPTPQTTGDRNQSRSQDTSRAMSSSYQEADDTRPTYIDSYTNTKCMHVCLRLCKVHNIYRHTYGRRHICKYTATHINYTHEPHTSDSARQSAIWTGPPV